MKAKRAVWLLAAPAIVACSYGANEKSSPLDDVKTEVIECNIKNRLPVANVRVTNDSDVSAAYAVTTRFIDNQTVLGTGLEYSEQLSPGQSQVVRMGNMQGDSNSVTDCEIQSVELIEN